MIRRRRIGYRAPVAKADQVERLMLVVLTECAAVEIAMKRGFLYEPVCLRSKPTPSLKSSPVPLPVTASPLARGPNRLRAFFISLSEKFRRHEQRRQAEARETIIV